MNSLSLIKRAIAVLEASIEDDFENYGVLYKKDKQLDYLYDLWEYYNKTLFDNKLPKVRRFNGFRWKKQTDNPKLLGGFDINNNTFRFVPGIFQIPFSKFKSVFLHEMCHQAQHYIGVPGDKNFTPATEGKINIDLEHKGPEWEYWTNKLGLNQSSIAYDIRNYDVLKDRHKEYLSNKLGKELGTVKKRK